MAKVRRTVASGACLSFYVKFLGVEIGHPKMESEPETKVSVYGQFRKGIRHFLQFEWAAQSEFLLPSTLPADLKTQ